MARAPRQTEKKQEPQDQGMQEAAKLIAEAQREFRKPKLGAITKTFQSEDFKTIYSNFSKVTVSQWDFTLTLGASVETTEKEAAFEEMVAVRFSPQYFKAIALSLTAALEQWESVFGEIPAGPGQSPRDNSGMGNAFKNLQIALEEAEKSTKKEN